MVCDSSMFQRPSGETRVEGQKTSSCPEVSDDIMLYMCQLIYLYLHPERARFKLIKLTDSSCCGRETQTSRRTAWSPGREASSLLPHVWVIAGSPAHPSEPSAGFTRCLFNAHCVNGHLLSAHADVSRHGES